MSIFKKFIEEQLSLHEGSDNDYSEYFNMGTDKYGGEKVFQLNRYSNPDKKGVRSVVELGNKISALKIIKMMQAGVK